MSSEKCMRVRFIIYNEEVENTVNDRLKKKLLCFECALSTLEGYEGWMIGTTTLHLDWQPKQGENEFCHTKLTPEIIKKAAGLGKEVLVVNPQSCEIVHHYNRS